MNFRQHKEKLLKNPKVRKEYGKLDLPSDVKQSIKQVVHALSLDPISGQLLLTARLSFLDRR